MTVKQIAIGVFLGNLLTAIVAWAVISIFGPSETDRILERSRSSIEVGNASMSVSP